MAAMALGPLLFFVLLELGLRLIGFGNHTSFFLHSQIRGRPVFIQNDRFAWRFFGPDLARTPQPMALAENKPADTVRIFVLGESAAYGDPQPEFGLPRLLSALLSARYPGARFEVVNAAMTAINSHAILPIARDCAALQGDIWIIYAGNNEVVGPYGAGTVFGSPAANLTLIRARIALQRTRTVQVLESIVRRFQKPTPAENEWGGMRMFLGNQVAASDPRMTAVYSHFAHNLADIIRVGERCGARIVVSTVGSNHKDCAPFASQHRPDLSASDLAQWERWVQKGAESQKAGRMAEAIESYQQAAKLDHDFAELHFRWAWCSLLLGHASEALTHFILARDLDTLRFRADSRINDIIRQTASGREQEGVWFSDGAEALARESPHGLIGTELLHEHVHLNFEGNYLLARTIADRVAQLLPLHLTQGTNAQHQWATPAQCARRLAYADSDRYAAKIDVLGRLNNPPFTAQLTRNDQCRFLQQELDELRPATESSALRQAVDVCREALAQAPDDWMLHQKLASLCQALGDYAGTERSWRRVVELMPHYAAAWAQLGAVLDLEKRSNDAVAAWSQALQLAPHDDFILNGLAESLAQQGKVEEATRTFEHLLRRKPYFGQAHLGLGRLLEKAGNLLEAEAHFRQAIQYRIRTPAAMRTLAQLCFDHRWFNEAATNFTDALRLNPFDAATHLNLGVTLGLLGQNEGARRHFTEAVRLDPSLAEARCRLGIELARQGNLEEATEQLTAAVKLKPELIEARLNLGIIWTRQQREAEALAQFQEVLRQSPTNATALKYAELLRAK